MFPTVIHQNLEYKKYTLPFDLEGELNIVLLPFQRWHQDLVDSWTEYLKDISLIHPQVKFYEVPTLSNGYKIMNFMIDGGMRAGIPIRNIRERTITIYVNKAKFKRDLQIPNEDTIYIFLINKQGEILWREKGSYTTLKGENLQNYLKNKLVNFPNLI